jgi:hypothetical protein
MYPSGEDFALVQFIFDDLVKKVCGYTVPRSVARARGILDRAMTCSESLQRQGFELDEEESDSENIGSSEVAELLGVTRRTVQRNAETLGGRQVSGSWVFNKDEVGAD